MKKISYLDLQKKYPRKLVALDRAERKILAVGESAEVIYLKLTKQHLDPNEYVLVGPIQKQGAINVYVSIRK